MYGLFTYLLGNKHANYNNWVVLIRYSQHKFTTYYITSINSMCAFKDGSLTLPLQLWYNMCNKAKLSNTDS